MPCNRVGRNPPRAISFRLYMPGNDEGEWLTRKQRISPVLDAVGWPKTLRPSRGPYRLEEFDTTAGPADYALCIDDDVLGVVEAKKLSLGPQNVLTQAERYSRGATSNPLSYGEFHVPFLYSTNGEVIWFADVRTPTYRSRKVASFHTPSALKEMLAKNFDAACRRLEAMPNSHERLRPYQREANAAVEAAIAARNREMLLAMATGTGKTFTLVNQVYRLMKSGAARFNVELCDEIRASPVLAVELRPDHKFSCSNRKACHRAGAA